jgi:hypothetical protein
MAVKKPTNDYLSAINSLLLEVEKNVLRPGEFTCKMFQEEYEKKMGPCGPSRIYRILEGEVKKKKMTSRKMIVDGKISNVYIKIK